MHFLKSGSSAIAESAITLTSNWRLLGCEPGAFNSPTELNEHEQDWIPAVVPGTVAQALQQAGKWDLQQSLDFDARDWWYQCRFDAEGTSAPARFLRFNGLATLADVWLNGERILQADNMFIEHVVDVSRLLQKNNELVIRFRALTAALAERRARPRWKTKLVQHQQLRWIRTTLLGRIPGWSPPVAPVGPWRDIMLDTREANSFSDLNLNTSLDGDTGIVDGSCVLELADPSLDVSATLHVGEHTLPLQVNRTKSTCRISGRLQIAQANLWWPHTHGEPHLYPCRLNMQIGGQAITLDCGQLGFRRISVEQTDGAFTLSVNGVPVFCRGACWTINDIVSLTGSLAELTSCLQQARDAGMNMLRVGGTMIYERNAFYALCDRLGILVWQDFMFANMDYPIEDEQFAAAVSSEITQQLKRWQMHPCIAVYCGNSEVEQQAAMLGMPQESWRSRLFAEMIPALCDKWHPHIPYVPSTPTGGTLPFHVGTGITHYYGVGAYLRPVTEVRRANVRFTPECLGFSNVPEDDILNDLFEGQSPVCHHPLWKSRVPRDSGTGWDFEDVRDHYLKTLFNQDPVALRSFDMPRYLALSRITSGEMMEQVFSEWRSPHSTCGGGLVWFYKDLWPGAGWGILDSRGQAKACYRYLQRVWQAQTVVMTDEGLDGVQLHVINERASDLDCRVELQLLRDGRVVVAKADQALTVPARASATLGSDEVLKGFYDVAYIYRFGPPKHDVVVATLFDANDKVIAEAFHFPGMRKTDFQKQVKLTAVARGLDNGDYQLQLECDTFLQAVHFDAKGYVASDEYFHLVPGRVKQITLRKTAEPVKRFKAYVESLSLEEAIGVTLTES
ncbi:MAG: glycoside hydrolase family 2 protein [Gammaproteobacteria bacterium]|nr:glycoside hydrolase family 2 protein [Gammaproteobacteria bacterium]